MRFHHSGPHDGKTPPEAYQLADHLDAALAAAEDLADAGRQWLPATSSAGFELAAQMAAERQVIERVCMFEAMLIGRVLKARKRAQMLARTAGDFTGMTRLFVSGTAPLLDALEEMGDSTRADFETGNCRMAYLRQRGVIAADAADLPENRAITLGDGAFLVAGRIALAPLTEMIIAFLDALEMHYDLYPDELNGRDPFGWPQTADTVRAGEYMLDSAAPAGEITMSAVTEPTAAKHAYIPEMVTANAADTARAETGAGSGAGAPVMTQPPATKAKTRSLAERLGEVTQTHE